MFFHRGLRLRPELSSFRLGIQKSQEAIEKTIGGFPKKSSSKTTSNELTKQGDSKQVAAAAALPQPKPVAVPTKQRPKTSKADAEKREARKLLGELCIDKEYLENLLKHPDLKRADTGSENISTLAKDAVQFLNTRQEFWRQQRPCTAMPSQKKKMIDSPFPKWY